MISSSTLLITLGSLLLLGLATDAIGRLTRLPRVTLLLVLGLAVGPEALDLLPVDGGEWFSISATCALVMVGFLLGERFTWRALREHGRDVAFISLIAVALTSGVVALGLLGLGVPLPLALLLGAVSASTAPAATADVVRESGIDSDFSRVLLGVVALDDAWGLILFAITLSAVAVIAGGGEPFAGIADGFREVGGAIALGGFLGIPLAYLSGRIRAGEPTLLEALGGVFLCGGLAIRMEVSPLLAAMTLGTVVANLAHHHTRPFHAIEEIERPFLVLFFVFAGASLRLESLGAVGATGAAYIVTRALGRLVGGWVGAFASGADESVRRWMGLALMPQAGIALGLALLAAERFPEQGNLLLSVVIGSTVVFELFGPLCTRYALYRTEVD